MAEAKADEGEAFDWLTCMTLPAIVNVPVKVVDLQTGSRDLQSGQINWVAGHRTLVTRRSRY